MATYNEDSIQKMDPLTFCRHRPDAYLGSNENSTQLVREIVSNCSDEFLIGNCDYVEINYDAATNVVKVCDTGQGILPNVVKEDGKTVLELVYGDINTSGKYDRSEDSVYKISTGAFGIGASLSNYLANWLIATTKRDGQYERVYFNEGKFEKRESGKCPKSEHGVEVEFHPSEEFFVDARPDIEGLKKELFNLSCVCAGLRIVFNGEEFYHPNGLADLVNSKIKTEDRIIENDFSFEVEEGNQKLDFYMTATDKSSCDIIPFCNYGLIETGAPVSAVKACLTKSLNKWGKEQGLIKGNNSIGGADIQEGMVIAFNLVSQNIRYDSQIKVRVTSTEDNPFINQNLAAKLLIWLDNNPEDGKSIIEKALLAKRASEAAKKARENVKAKKKAAKNKVKIMNPDKLKDAEYLGKDSMLLLVEGLSAGASISVARDSTRFGILMLRGKLINSFTNNEAKLLKNEEIQLLFKALNISPNHYDPNELRYGKLGICVDQDSDGKNISLLIMAALQHFCPQFIEEGRLCWLQSPLYIVKDKKKETYYYTDQELEVAKKAGKVKGEVQRNKGLGSLSPEQAKASMFGDNPRLEIMKSSPEAIALLEMLMGKQVAPRKEYIFNNIDFSEVRE